MKKNFYYLFLIFVALLLYSFSLDKVPVHLNQDEMEFSLNAYSISRTLRDQSGNFLPFYFWHLDGFWATPIITYLAAIFLKFLPISETTIRLPSVTVGISTIALLMVLSQKLFKNKTLTLTTGAMAATTPVLFIHSRLLLDVLYPVPFILLWLIFLLGYLKKRNPLSLFSSGLALGIGIHSYHASKITMPLYFLLTIIIFFKELKSDLKSLFLFIIAFFIPIILFLPWLLIHPDTLLNQVGYISAIDRSINANLGIFGVFSPERLGSFVSNYFTYFSPDILFFTGDKSLIHSTRQAGAFLFPLVFPLVFGIIKAVFSKEKFYKLILIGFLAYPTAPSIVNDPQRISRGLVVIPFVILLSVLGLRYLLGIKRKVFKVLIISIFILGVLEFGLFLNHYFGSYRKESYAWFNNDIGGALESVIKSTKIRNVDKVYIDSNIYFIERYVKFYSLKFASNLYQRAEYFDPRVINFSEFPKGSLVLVSTYSLEKLEDRVGTFERVETIREPNGYETFFVYYRDK